VNLQVNCMEVKMCVGLINAPGYKVSEADKAQSSEETSSESPRVQTESVNE